MPQAKEYEPGTNIAYYELEKAVCQAIQTATPETLARLARLIERRGTATLVRELATMLPGFWPDGADDLADPNTPDGQAGADRD